MERDGQNVTCSFHNNSFWSNQLEILSEVKVISGFWGRVNIIFNTISNIFDTKSLPILKSFRAINFQIVKFIFCP